MPPLIEGPPSHYLLDRIPIQMRSAGPRRFRLHQFALVVSESNEINPVVTTCRRLVATIPPLGPQYVRETLEVLPVHLQSHVERDAFVQTSLVRARDYLRNIEVARANIC